MFKLFLLFILLSSASITYSQVNPKTKIDLPEWIFSMIGYYDIYKDHMLSDSILVVSTNIDSLGNLHTIKEYKPRVEPTFDGYIEWLKDISTYFEKGNKRYKWQK